MWFNYQVAEGHKKEEKPGPDEASDSEEGEEEPEEVFVASINLPGKDEIELSLNRKPDSSPEEIAEVEVRQYSEEVTVRQTPAVEEIIKVALKVEIPLTQKESVAEVRQQLRQSSLMERVDSSAMQSLAAYDSDEELTSPTGGDRRRRSSDNRKQGRSSDTELSPDGDFGMIRDDFVRPRPIHESRLTENPEAPPSREGSIEPQASDDKRYQKRPETRPVAVLDDEFSPEPPPPKRQAMGEDQEFSDEEDLAEPPPPNRPQFYASPSPAPRSVSESPAVKKEPGLSGDLKSTASAVSLVSYAAAEDDDLDQSRASVKEDKEGHPGGETENQDSAEPSPSEQKDSKELGESVDVDAYLEQALEGKPVQEWSTGSEGGDSPASIETLTNPLDLQIPPEPKTACSQELNDRFLSYFQQKARGMDFNRMFQKRKDFRNPSIYEKLIEHFGIDEMGSNFPKSVFDPHGFKPSDYYDKLAEVQKVAMDKLEKEKRHKPSESVADKKAAAIIAEAKSRKSKWDNPSSAGGSGPHPGSKAPSSADPKKAKVK